jgi:hypothetical protein
VSETEKSASRWPVLRALLLVGVCGGIGALALPNGFAYLVMAGWTSSGGAALGTAVLYFAVVTALLVGAATLVPEVSGLTRSVGGRVSWALTVTVVGTIVWYFAFSVHSEVERELDRNAMMAFPLSAVPFALVAGLFLRRWYFKIGTIALVVVSGLGLLSVLSGTEPNEVDARLAAAHVDRRTVFVAEIPGYHRVPQQLSWTLVPDDPQLIPPPRYISLFAYPNDPTADCQPHPNDSTMAGFPCTVEQPGLTYIAGVAEHEYFHRKGNLVLHIVGTLAVDRGILRDAILTARETGEPGIYTTDIDGYESQPQGTPPGTAFSLKDKARSPGAKNVEVSGSRIPHAGECAEWQQSPAESPFLECVAERPDLHYERLAEHHLYYAQHGSWEVMVMGGIGVDRNVLRDAALSARPATDEELMTYLPLAPPAPRTFMSRLKGFAKYLLG